LNRNVVARCLALVLIGICLATYVRHDIEKMNHMGREQFLASKAETQARRFDRTANTRAPLVVSVIAAVFLIVCVFLSYELLVFAISKGLKFAGIGTDSSATPRSLHPPFS
jgi:hypothetical protein